MASFNSVSDYKQTIYVTVVYIIMWYIFLYLQSFGKTYLYYQYKRNRIKDIKDGKHTTTTDTTTTKKSFADIKYKSNDKISILLDGTVGNMIEQGIPFIISLWLNAIFVSSNNAASIGMIYITFRIIYPLVFYYGLPWILISTIPGYACIFLLLYQCVQKSYYS